MSINLIFRIINRICFFQSVELRVLMQNFLSVNKYPEIQYLIAEVYPSITKGTVVSNISEDIRTRKIKSSDR